MNWVRHGNSATCSTAKIALLFVCLFVFVFVVVLHGSSSTWFQTSRYCRAKVEFNSINLVRHGSSKTFETGLSLPGHPLVLQERFSAGDPRHLRPPWAGRGLEHVRDLVCVPSPHDLVHTLQDLHSLQLPSTEKKGAKCFKKWFFLWCLLALGKGWDNRRRLLDNLQESKVRLYSYCIVTTKGGGVAEMFYRPVLQ